MQNQETNVPTGGEWIPEFRDTIQVVVAGGGVADSVAWKDVRDKPNTVEGYGIINACTDEDLEAALATKADAATTLSGYGITDAKIEGNTITLGETSITVSESSEEMEAHISDDTRHATSEVKNSPSNEDSFVIVDSKDSNRLKRFPVANMNALFSCVLRISFDADFAGREFTVTGGNEETYTDIVPDSLTIDINVGQTNAVYVVRSTTAGGDQYSVSVTTGEHFGLYEVSLIIPRATIHVTTCVGASVRCSNGSKQLEGIGSTVFTLPTTGEWNVQAELNGVSVNQTVMASEIKQYNIDLMITSGLSIITPPEKTTYDIGDTFNSAGIAVNAVYADGTTEDVTNACTYSPAKLSASTTEITVSYTRVGITVTTTQPVTVKALAKIVVATPPFKTSYYAGETFNSTGTVIEAVMTDDSTKTVLGWTYSPTDALTPETNVITFSYTENGITKTCSYELELFKLTSISVTTAPANTTYHYGDTFSSSGMEITATYDDGSTRKVSGWAFEPSLPLTTEVDQITVSYTEGNISKTCVQPIKVLRLDSLVITTPPAKTAYLYGEEFERDGMVISAVYEDGSMRVVSGWSYTPVEALTLSDSNVVISYAEGDLVKTVHQAITVTNTLDRIAVTTPPSTLDYSDGDLFDPTGMVVTAFYADGTSKAVSNYTWTPETIGKDTTEVIISFTDLGSTKEAAVPIVVVNLSILNECSWAQIRAISDAGEAANYWSVGDTKEIIINGTIGDTTFDNLAIDVFILGFDHNAGLEGHNTVAFSIGRIDGQDVGLMDKNYYSNKNTGKFSYNQAPNTEGGWGACKLRRQILGNDGTPENPVENSMMAVCPADLVAVLKPVTKYSNNTGGKLKNTAEDITPTTDYFFCLSAYEVSGKSDGYTLYEREMQEQYAYYAAGNSWIKKYPSHKTGTLTMGFGWSLRTPDHNEGSNQLVCISDYARNVTYHSRADFHSLLSPAFCV